MILAIPLAGVGFTATSPVARYQAMTVQAAAPGLLNGVLVYLDAELAPDVLLSTHPSAADARCAWRSALWLLPEPFETVVGTSVEIGYSYGTRSPAQVDVRRLD